MKKEKHTPEEFTSIINGFRMQHQNDTFTSGELSKKLMDLGFGKNVAYAIMLKSFPSTKIGQTTVYEIPKEPIHKSVIVGAIQKQRDHAREYAHNRKCPQQSVVSSLDSALAAVQAAGYRVSKPIFDYERFAKEHPEMVAKYTKYELI